MTTMTVSVVAVNSMNSRITLSSEDNLMELLRNSTLLKLPMNPSMPELQLSKANSKVSMNMFSKTVVLHCPLLSVLSLKSSAETSKHSKFLFKHSSPVLFQTRLATQDHLALKDYHNGNSATVLASAELFAMQLLILSPSEASANANTSKILVISSSTELSFNDSSQKSLSPTSTLKLPTLSSKSWSLN